MPKRTAGGRRGAYHHGDLRRALIEATLRLIGERGAAGITLREVARRAGVSHSAPYRHFPSRDALLAAVAEEGFGALSQLTDRTADAAASPTERLIHRGVAYVSFALDRPAHYRVMFGPVAGKDRYPGLVQAAQRTVDGLVADIRSGQQAGVFGDSDATELANVAWALVHGLADLAIGHRLASRDRERVETLTALAATVLANGLARSRHPG